MIFESNTPEAPIRPPDPPDLNMVDPCYTPESRISETPAVDNVMSPVQVRARTRDELSPMVQDEFKKSCLSTKRKGKKNSLMNKEDMPANPKKSAQFVLYGGDTAIPEQVASLPAIERRKKGRKKGILNKNKVIDNDTCVDINDNSNVDVIVKSIDENAVSAKPICNVSPVVFFKGSKDVDSNMITASESATKMFKKDGVNVKVSIPANFSQFSLGGVSNDITSPTVIKTGHVPDEGGTKRPRAWANPNSTFADIMKQNKENDELKMEYIPPVLLSNGKKRVVFTEDEVKKGGSAFSLQLYGYFIGTSIDYRVVNAHLRRMWWRYDLKEVTKAAAGFYLCKFKSEKGMKEVLKNGPWLVNNVPFFVNQWEPGVWLEKIEPARVPIWICIHNIPIELWNGRGISKLVSSIGKPITMDKVTTYSCLQKSGRLGFARVLAEVNASDELPSSIEFAYPSFGSFPAKVGQLEVTYQWKPPLCTYCKVFGHTTKVCSKRPRTEDEVAAQIIKDAIRVDSTVDKINMNDVGNDDGFQIVGKKGRVFDRLKFTGNNAPKNSGKIQHDVQNVKSPNFKRSGTLPFKGNIFDKIRQQNSTKWVPSSNNRDKASTSGTANDKQHEVTDIAKLIEERSVPVAIPVMKSSSQKKKQMETGKNIYGLKENCVLEEIVNKEQDNLNKFASKNVFATLATECNVMDDGDEAECVTTRQNNINDVESEEDGTAQSMRLDDDNFEAIKLGETHVNKSNLVNVGNLMFPNWDWISNAASCKGGTRIIVGWDPRSVDVIVIDQHAQAFHCFIVPSFGGSGSSFITKSMSEFHECVSEIEVDDISWSGLNFTWNQTPGKTTGIMKKLDRVMGNVEFIEKFPSATSVFMPFLMSDHSPMILTFPDLVKAKPRPFKFYNYLTTKAGFLPIVNNMWKTEVNRHAMYCVVTKLKSLKKPLRKLNYEQGNLFEKVKKLKVELERVQEAVVRDPSNVDLREEEAMYVKAYKEAIIDEELFLKQKSKIEWLKEGDQNSKFFHKAVKEGIIGIESILLKICMISFEYAHAMVRLITDDEIKAALFDIEYDKAPGPDGPDVCTAVKEYFQNGKLLNEVNSTIIALVPKLAAPKKVNDFRPIACCTVLYKCISKVITNRIKNVLDGIVDENQSAFIPGRQISDNILLSQELMRNYHKKVGPPKCAFKIDVQKAYDSVEWPFLRSCLLYFGFHPMMVWWIMNCVTSTSFTINVNGDHVGYFKGKRGLRQGDPMSPYLFTLVMKVLTLMIRRRVEDDDEFKYHWRCEDVKLTHLCFADDLLMFCHGDKHSASILKNALFEFSGVSGLVASMEKSSSYFSNVRPSIKAKIAKVLPFSEGSLPVRYLGVPLLATRLYRKDCVVLIDKVKKRIFDWKNKSLSFAGRLQLINSVLCSLQVYWASMFILPKSVNADIERLLRNFLWSQGEFKRGKAKVNWNEVCRPKVKGGLGIKNLHTWNIALMSKHAWNIVSDKNSIWAKWVKKVKLKKRNFWDFKAAVDSCWSWKKIMQNRELIAKFIVKRIGNGSHTSAWFDNWHPVGPLCKFIGYRDLYEAGFKKNEMVADIVVNGDWKVPDLWKIKFKEIFDFPTPVLIADRVDMCLWKSRSGKTSNFTVKCAWQDLSEDWANVNWAKLVWFSQCIPRHSFITWVALHGKLRTQDKYMRVESNNDLRCPFCKLCKDSHSHLFFDCDYPRAVWNELKLMANLDHAPNEWTELVEYLLHRPINRTVWSIIQRLVFGSCVYFIWQEQNLRLFQGKCRSVDDLVLYIKKIVKFRLLGLTIKNNSQTKLAADIWDIDFGPAKNVGDGK
ncbi:uncharacterized protein [Rutidosis leptorrhynchoides]|uniref:uncharacterized protein n=1 Tax=Rutidosis leptorrhynchoides TaxID=125765 RepID=UPI003A993A78